jgi:hypothetical protein
LKKLIFILIFLVITAYLGYYYYYIPYFDKNKLGIVDSAGSRVKFPTDKPYILCYIQSWCRDCIAETPCLMEFSKVNNIPVYFVTDEDSGLMKRYRKRFDYDLPIYYSQQKFRDNGTLLFPTAYFYGENGAVLYNKMERIDSAELTSYLEKLN